MKRFSIPAFIDNLVPDAANTKYSKGKLKMYYIGETVDHRVFTKEFSDKLLATAAYTPVVGYYSVADEDFVGHNSTQNIYGLIPAEAEITYEEDAEKGVSFAVTDIILYTGRPDETGAIAAKIIGKQHSLELNPETVQYKINRDEAGNFKNIEFVDGELIGLSVLGDKDRPAFSGSEFFSAEELPEFITEDNRGKYEALFNTMFSIEPTAEEAITEIYRAMSSQGICGYVCEHIADKYAVINSNYGIYTRYLCSRDAAGTLVLTVDCNVRARFLSDQELETLSEAQKGSLEVFEDDETTQSDPAVEPETTAGVDTTASVGGNEGLATSRTEEEFEALRSDCERLTNEIAEVTANYEQAQAAHAESVQTFREGIMQGYRLLISAEAAEAAEAAFDTMSLNDFIAHLASVYADEQSQAKTEVVEITTIDTEFGTYDETDPVAVVQKYLNR